MLIRGRGRKNSRAPNCPGFHSRKVGNYDTNRVFGTVKCVLFIEVSSFPVVPIREVPPYNACTNVNVYYIHVYIHWNTALFEAVLSKPLYLQPCTHMHDMYEHRYDLETIT